MLVALTRSVSPTLQDCELTYLPRQPLDLKRAVQQHRDYESCLRELGVRVVSLPTQPDLPDAAFVEDTAVVVDEVAVIGSMGSEKRRREVHSVAEALSRFRDTKHFEADGMLEGGDVMRIGRRLYVGLSTRTNEEGIAELQRILRPYDYEIVAVRVNGCLHFKTGCTYVGRGACLVNSGWVDTGPLSGLQTLEVHPEEPWAANTLLVGETLVMPSMFPRTRAALERRGFEVRVIDISEIAKAEGGVTCMSILFESD